MLNSRADWLLKLRISFAIHLRAIRAEFVPENVVISAGINGLNSSFCVDGASLIASFALAFALPGFCLAWLLLFTVSLSA